MESPSQRLSKKIIDRLVKEKVLTPARGERLQSRLAEGNFSAEDWKVEIELSQRQSEVLSHE